MKKLLFVLSLTFIGGQAFSQIYIATLLDEDLVSGTGCMDLVLVKVDPLGTQTTSCIPYDVSGGGLITLNQELNSIISMGYKMIQTLPGRDSYNQQPGYINAVYGQIQPGTTFIFAIP
jgi:hypothetical protein